jgi:hypothetical protein
VLQQEKAEQEKIIAALKVDATTREKKLDQNIKALSEYVEELFPEVFLTLK